MQEQLLTLREEHTREIQHFQESRASEQQSLTEEYTREIQQLQEAQARKEQFLREEHTREFKNLREIQLSEREGIIVGKEHEIQDLLQSHDEAIAAKERAIRQLRVQLEQTTYRTNEREQAIKGQLIPSKDQTQLGTKGDSQEYADGTNYILKLTWRRGKPAPQKMYRRCNAVVDKTMVYFNVRGGSTVYCCNTNRDIWTRLPDCPNTYSSFTVINNMLTAIGGINIGRQHSSKVYNLKEGGAWIEIFLPMPTKRSSATVICTKSSLIVIGGSRWIKTMPR